MMMMMVVIMTMMITIIFQWSSIALLRESFVAVDNPDTSSSRVFVLFFLFNRYDLSYRGYKINSNNNNIL